VPVVGLVLAVALEGEHPSAWTTAGLSVVLGSLWLVLRGAKPHGERHPALAPVSGSERPPWAGRDAGKVEAPLPAEGSDPEERGRLAAAQLPPPGDFRVPERPSSLLPASSAAIAT
jgi:hypothetical protein